MEEELNQTFNTLIEEKGFSQRSLATRFILSDKKSRRSYFDQSMDIEDGDEFDTARKQVLKFELGKENESLKEDDIGGYLKRAKTTELSECYLQKKINECKRRRKLQEVEINSQFSYSINLQEKEDSQALNYNNQTIGALKLKNAIIIAKGAMFTLVSLTEGSENLYNSNTSKDKKLITSIFACEGNETIFLGDEHSGINVISCEFAIRQNQKKLWVENEPPGLIRYLKLKKPLLGCQGVHCMRTIKEEENHSHLIAGISQSDYLIDLRVKDAFVNRFGTFSDAVVQNIMKENTLYLNSIDGTMEIWDVRKPEKWLSKIEKDGTQDWMSIIPERNSVVLGSNLRKKGMNQQIVTIFDYLNPEKSTRIQLVHEEDEVLSKLYYDPESRYLYASQSNSPSLVKLYELSKTCSDLKFTGNLVNQSDLSSDKELVDMSCNRGLIACLIKDNEIGYGEAYINVWNLQIDSRKRSSVLTPIQNRPDSRFQYPSMR